LVKRKNSFKGFKRRLFTNEKDEEEFTLIMQDHDNPKDRPSTRIICKRTKMFKPVPKEYERDNWRDIAIKIDNQRDSEDEENE